MKKNLLSFAAMVVLAVIFLLSDRCTEQKTDIVQEYTKRDTLMKTDTIFVRDIELVTVEKQILLPDSINEDSLEAVIKWRFEQAEYYAGLAKHFNSIAGKFRDSINYLNNSITLDSFNFKHTDTTGAKVEVAGLIAGKFVVPPKITITIPEIQQSQVLQPIIQGAECCNIFCKIKKFFQGWKKAKSLKKQIKNVVEEGPPKT